MKNILSGILRDPEFPEGECWRRRRFDANETIVREGDQDRTMYLIERGTLRVSGRVSLDDERHIQPGLCDLGPGDPFGELTLFEPLRRTASVVAIDPGELVEIDCERLAAYLEQRPELGFAVLKTMFRVLIDRLRTANQRVEHLFAWGLRVHGIDQHL
jgi:CRP/FNR family cyclic AMP-dependent transcriptional regulator